MALPPIDYYFEADVFIDESDWTRFDTKYPGAGRRVVQCLESVGITLVCSLLKEDQTSRHDHARRGRVYYNYWRLGPNLNILSDKLRLLADDPFWAEFCNGIYKEEEKEIIVPLSQATSTDVPNFQNEGAKYLLLEYELDHFAVPLFRARLEEETVKVGKERGWLLGHSFVHHTGVEGKVVQIWLVPEHTTFTEQEAKLLPWCANFGSRKILRAASAGLYKRSEFDVKYPFLQELGG